MITPSDHLTKIRHSLAHALAQAVTVLFPKTKVTIGPPIDTGCYYDFQFSEPISDADFSKIEREIRRIINQGQTFECQTLSVADSIAYWKEHGQPFKVELVEDLIKNEGVTEVTHYINRGPKGEISFVDLCRGGHVESMKDIPGDAFKIMSLAGAYWRGDESREQLTRVYVAAYSTKEDLDAYLHQLDEAKKRDHRKLGKELDLFTFSELVGPGLPLWTARGTLLRNLLDGFVWELREAKGYERVTIPHITKKELYETSGHWQKFSTELFKITTREGHEFAMKPMNCPHHTQIFASQQRSYRSLPQRYAETTMCYRDEQTGELHGLSRVRGFTQDDAHVFCRTIQVEQEILKIWEIIDTFYATVGFGSLNVRLSLHDPQNMQNYLGTKELWQQAENSLRTIAKDRNAQFVEAKGEAAFYGPKVDFVTKDAIGREWQVATIQLDINMPERFDLYCINETGEKERIVMIHAAIMGSIERFLSMYIEHTAGHFPLWLAPMQLSVIPVNSVHQEYAEKLVSLGKSHGLRMEILTAEDSLGKRIRDAQKRAVPLMLVLGEKEVADSAVTIRATGSGEQWTLPMDTFFTSCTTLVKQRSLQCTF